MTPFTLLVAMPAVFLLGVVGSFSSALNGQVGKRLGTFQATFVFLAIGALWCVPLIAVFEWGSFAAIWHGLPWYLYLPGLINTFLIASLIFVVNRIGTMLMTSAMFCGQVFVSIGLDHIGFLGLPTIPITSMRIIAAIILIVGIAIAVTRPRHTPIASDVPLRVRVLALAMAFGQGATLAVVSGLNAVLGIETGTFTATFFFLAPGAAFLLLWFASRRTPVRLDQLRIRYLVPGSLNVIGIAGTVVLVPIVGLQFTVATRVTASVLAGLHIDQRGLFGLPQQAISMHRIVGTIVLSLGVVLTVLR